MRVGNSYVFIGKNIKETHFTNFTYGKTYRISSTTTLSDTDLYGDDFAILFDNHAYGCLSCHFDKYFISLDDFRNQQLLEIIKND